MASQEEVPQRAPYAGFNFTPMSTEGLTGNVEPVKSSTTEREVAEALNADGSITVTTTITVDGTATTEEATYESVEAYKAFKEQVEAGEEACGSDEDDQQVVC
jgi:hypothetical protein